MKNEDDLHISNSTEKFSISYINILFSTYGGFTTGLFSIIQYFFPKKYILLCFCSIVLIVWSLLSINARKEKNINLWQYIYSCSNNNINLNPIIFLIGLYTIFSNTPITLGICMCLTILQFIIYISVFKKEFPKMKFVIIEKIKIWSKNNSPLLITGLFSIISFILWLISADELKISDLFLNLLAGFISSFVTIAVIDSILKKQKEINDKPLRKALYRDVQLFTSRLLSFWSEVYKQSITEAKELTIEELFSLETMDSIYNNLNLENYPNVLPKQNWFTYIKSTHEEFVNLGEKILVTYANIAEPELIQAIHHIINDSPYVGLLCIINKVHTVDIQQKIPRETLLGNYIPQPTQESYNSILQLLSWCRNNYEKLNDMKQNGFEDIYEIPNRVILPKPKTK